MTLAAPISMANGLDPEGFGSIVAPQ